MTEVRTTVGPAWPELDDVPDDLRARVSAPVARWLLGRIARRLGIVVLDQATPGAWPDAPTIVLHRPAEFYARTGRDGLIGFGEAYMTGAWDSPDLARVLTALAGSVGTLVPAPLRRGRRWYVARRPAHHDNTTSSSRRNVAHHYDLSNELFASFLDETMTYSSALFSTPYDARPDDLAAAQARKIERLLDLAEVGPGAEVLEIGTGWGELAIRAARRGATVHTVTLSAEQLRLAEDRISAAGLADRVRVELADYREVRGSYDAVVSVEMIEAVGHAHLPAYFTALHDRLRPGGRAALQAIVMPHERMLETMGTHTWVTKYVFPGGFLPSSRLLDRLAADAGLRVADRLAFGAHYAETLRLWDEAFGAVVLEALGFDEVFGRMWHFYLCYSRAGFASGYLDVEQLLLTRPEGSR